MLLKLQFIRGLKDKNIRTKLLQDKKNFKFKEILEIASTIELLQEECKLMDTSENKNLFQVKSDSNNVPKLNTAGNSNRQQYLSRRRPSVSTVQFMSSFSGKCFRCGSSGHRANTCKFRNEFCRKCDKLGHVAKVCRSRPAQRQGKGTHQMVDDQEDITDQNVYEIPGSAASPSPLAHFFSSTCLGGLSLPCNSPHSGFCGHFLSLDSLLPPHAGLKSIPCWYWAYPSPIFPLLGSEPCLSPFPCGL
ncbi:hypothetical protein M8J76_008367 [Diaphorina citri]|nr:hypothetical protein M8J76_008367 [Diaphorina citri]